MTKCYSIDGEDFNLDDIGEVIEWVDELEDNPDSLTNHSSLSKSVL